MQAKLFLTDDPALVVLYSQLRHKTLQTLRGASKVTPKVEWAFVLHNARLYDRMGCDLLALDLGMFLNPAFMSGNIAKSFLVRNWEFLLPTVSKYLGGETDPRDLLRRRSSLVVADLPMSMSLLDIKPKSTHPPHPSVFEEPESSSLLDSFGL